MFFSVYCNIWNIYNTIYKELHSYVVVQRDSFTMKQFVLISSFVCV